MSSPMFRVMKTCLVVVLAALMVAPSVFAQQTSPAIRPKDFENSLEATMEIIKEAGLDDDPVLNARLNNIAYRVAQRANADITTFSFRIVKMEEPNAFALPGGFIFVTTGMMNMDLTDDELAALLGHEITHVVEDHSHKMAKRQTLMNLLYQALMIGVAVGIKDNPGYNPATGLPNRSAKTEILQGS